MLHVQLMIDAVWVTTKRIPKMDGCAGKEDETPKSHYGATHIEPRRTRTVSKFSRYSLSSITVPIKDFCFMKRCSYIVPDIVQPPNKDRMNNSTSTTCLDSRTQQ